MKKVWEEFWYRLTQTSVFRYSDFNKLFILYTDTSKEGIGVVLCQKDEDVEADYVIQYYSRTLVKG